MKLYLESTREQTKGKRYAVLSYDPETKKGIVQGEQGSKFETAMDKETLVKYGYKVVKSED
jgi:hypothetical protein